MAHGRTGAAPELKHSAARIISYAGTLNALGHRIRRDGWQALPRALRRFVKRVRGIVLETGPPVDVQAAVASAVGVRLF